MHYIQKQHKRKSKTVCINIVLSMKEAEVKKAIKLKVYVLEDVNHAKTMQAPTNPFPQ